MMIYGVHSLASRFILALGMLALVQNSAKIRISEHVQNNKRLLKRCIFFNGC